MTTPGYSLVIDGAGIATVTFDLPGKVNIMNDDFMMAMPRVLEVLETPRADLRGVILTSKKSTFFAGGDLALMRRAKKGQEQFLFEHFELLKSFFRRLERLKRPLVAAINGSALGGGYELCLACHHRIALANPKTRIGLPEVNFGILPAAGGVIRLTAILGLLPALDFLVSGRAVDVDAALHAQLIHEIVDTDAALMARAREWIIANPEVRHSWDKAGNVERSQAANSVTISSVAPWLEKAVGGSSLAARRIAEIAVESLSLDFDTVSQIETRGFVELVLTEEANRKISNFFEASSQRRAG